ncbi:MAG: DEAD/DEAH box helicase [Anaerolineae bacterium]|nr:DEAD/DEAH box helicase [Phycisphaerae bacterium]
MKFADLKLSDPILRAVLAEGYTVATPIQAQAVPHILAGHDLIGSAQTGTGKTAAFALPILERLRKDDLPVVPGRPKVLVLCPTRELASQIADGFRAYGANLHIRHYVIFGGVNQRPQADALRRGVDIVIATPGRLLDLANQRLINLSDVHTLVHDEADRKLDMGFIHDNKRIVATLRKDRQTLMFSATMPPEIRELCNSLLRNPVKVHVTPVSTTADNISQSVYFVDKKNKPQLLAHLYHELPMARTIVFMRTKHGADKLIAKLHSRGIKAEAIHGNKSQNARQRALHNFKTMKTPVLVATDIAARGIDVDGITHVVNYDVTHEPETYIHRIGRTARAGASGAAISLCDRDERSNLKAIERLIKKPIPVCDDHPEYVNEPKEADSGHRDRDSRDSGSRRGSSHSQPRHSDAQHREHGEPRHAESRHAPAGGRHANGAKSHAPSRAPHSKPAHAGARSGSGQHRVGAAPHPFAAKSAGPNKFRGKPRGRGR